MGRLYQHNIQSNAVDLLARVFHIVPDDRGIENADMLQGSGSLQPVLVLEGNRLVLLKAAQPPSANFLGFRALQSLMHARYNLDIGPDEAVAIMRELSTSGSSENRLPALYKSIPAVLRPKDHTDLFRQLQVLLTSTLAVSPMDERNDLADHLHRTYGGRARLLEPRLSNGQILRVVDVGRADGDPILFLHGTLFPLAPAPDDLHKLEASGYRLLIPLRPGFFDLPGQWHGAPQEKLDRYCDAVVELLRTFKLDDLPIAACSFGFSAAFGIRQRLGSKGRLSLFSPQYLPRKEIARRNYLQARWFDIALHFPGVLSTVLKVMARRVRSTSDTYEGFARVYEHDRVELQALKKLSALEWAFECVKLTARTNHRGFAQDMLTSYWDWLATACQAGPDLRVVYAESDPFSNAHAVRGQMERAGVDVVEMPAVGRNWQHFETSMLIQELRRLRPGLSSKERDVMRLIAQGHRNDAIAGQLGLAEVTVRHHLKNVRQKLGARTREHALAICLKNGML